MTHICIGKLTIIGTDHGLSPERRQAIIWTNAGMLLNRRLGTNFSEILIGNQTFSFKKMHLKMPSVKWRPSCLGFNVLTHCGLVMPYGRVSFHFLTQIWVNIDSGNDLLPDGTKPLPEPMSTSLSRHSVALTWETISQVLINLICNMCLKITIFLKITFKSPRGQWVKLPFSYAWMSNYILYSFMWS